MGIGGSIFEKKYTTPARMISKILAAVSEAAGKELSMVEVLNVKKYWKIMTDLGTGKLKTDFFNFKAVSL